MTTSRPRSAHWRHDRGQITPLLVAVLVVAGVSLLALGRLGAAAADRARAQTAADASALAGATDGRPAAERFVAANGARLVAYRSIGSDVVVTVAVRAARATARARADAASSHALWCPPSRTLLPCRPPRPVPSAGPSHRMPQPP